MQSLIQGNESVMVSMLDGCPADASRDVLLLKLREVMGISGISIPQMLARFVPAELLRKYCQDVLGCSDKGTETVLADRIDRAWAKPTFQPPTDSDSGQQNNSGRRNSTGDTSPASTLAPASTATVTATAATMSSTELSEKRQKTLRKQKAKQDDYFIDERFKVRTKEGAPWRKGRFTKSWIDEKKVGRWRLSSQVVVEWRCVHCNRNVATWILFDTHSLTNCRHVSCFVVVDGTGMD